MIHWQAGCRSTAPAPHPGARLRAAAAALLSAACLAAPRAEAAAPAPVAIAVFDFEMEDFSAGASSSGASQADAGHLSSVTDEVRRILAQSGRYRLVDVGRAGSGESAAGAAAKARALRHCGGCDAEIARTLGAEQSFVGVVRRISRTEYLVWFQIRDARSGAVVLDGNSGLNMGADYSWIRGAGRLVRARLTESQDRR
ncbi:DUF2380 domain-containing protein [Arenibaculum pallidiluteum]|uniref:DUF2380 domain-containing protein n=1 Tax=Arenibaculum pallidiluteum TaxID=2812559 RepID=UPI001A95798E|nr:DUF2380 domain-containing protein [Arenibaculum pallidiluteum]